MMVPFTPQNEETKCPKGPKIDETETVVVDAEEVVSSPSSPSSPSPHHQQSSRPGSKNILRRALLINTWLLLSLAVSQQQNSYVAATAPSTTASSSSSQRKNFDAPTPPQDSATFEAEPSLYDPKDTIGHDDILVTEESVELEEYGTPTWEDEDGMDDNDDGVIVITTVSGTMAGISRTTGKVLWKRSGRMKETDSNSPAVRGDAEEQKILNPIVSTTTTTKTEKDWRTAAVPSVDGRVFLTAGRDNHFSGGGAGGGHSGDMTATSTVRELVSKAPFMDTRGRWYVGSSHATTAAIDRKTGEILKVVAVDNEPNGVAEEDARLNSFDDRSTVWVGRIDYTISLFDARSGVLDVQFSASEVMSANDMANRGGLDKWDGLSTNEDGSQQHAPRLMLPDSENDHFQPDEGEPMLVATPSGNVALRNPVTGTIDWVSNESFDSAVVFAVESSSGMSLGVDIVPDVPVPSNSAEYLSRELERQMEALISDKSQEVAQTVFGALASGQLFGMPLGQRLSKFSKSSLPLGLPQAASSSSANGASKALARVPNLAGRQPGRHGAPFTNEEKRHAPRFSRKSCLPSSPGYPACLVGGVHRMDDFSSQTSFLDPITGQYKGSEVLALYQQPYGFFEPHQYMQKPRKRKKQAWFTQVMGSWLPATMVLIFVLSFQLGRRHRLEAKKRKEADIEKSTKATLESRDDEKVSIDEKGRPIRSVGVIQVTDEVLGFGGHGTVVYRGMLDGRKVAVKRMLKAYHASADREISLLIESDGHPNVVRYFLKEVQGDFVYLALELCDLSLHSLIGTLRQSIPEPIQGLHISTAMKATLFQIACGVRHLHSLRIVHRDLKPANILLALNNLAPNTKSGKDSSGEESVLGKFERGQYVAKISDMGLGKQLAGQSSFGVSTLGNNSIQGGASNGGSAGAAPGSVGWQAPEVMAIRWSSETASVRSDASPRGGHDCIPDASPLEVVVNTRTSRSIDIFSLGCIFHCTLVPGTHPFGEWYEREANIMRNNPSTEILRDLSIDAHDLVSSMIQRDPRSRPTAQQITEHPFFWPQQRKLAFLCDLSDRIEADAQALEDGSVSSSSFGNNILMVERNASQVVGTAWDKELDADLLSNVQRFRTYDPSSVRDLLRLIRNKHHHYDELPPEVKRRIGGLLDYFEQRFPRLLMHCYSLCRDFLRETDQLVTEYAIPTKYETKDEKQPHRMESRASTTSDDKNTIPEGTGVVTLTPEPPPQETEEPILLDNECTDHPAEVDDCLLEEKKDSGEEDKGLPLPSTAPVPPAPEEPEQPPPQQTSASQIVSEPSGVVIWEGSTAAKTFGCRGWMRSEDEWARRTDTSLRKRDGNVMRCATDAKFRTRLCNHWDVSHGTFCPMKRKNKCVFAHGPVELRVKEGKRHRWGRLVDKGGNNSNPNHSGGEDTYGAARSIESIRKEEGKWNTDKGGASRHQKGKGKQSSGKKAPKKPVDAC